MNKIIEIGKETGVFNTIADALKTILTKVKEVVNSEEFKNLLKFLGDTIKKVIDVEMKLIDNYGLLGGLILPAAVLSVGLLIPELLATSFISGLATSLGLTAGTSIKLLPVGIVIVGILEFGAYEFLKDGEYLKGELCAILGISAAAITIGPAGVVIAGAIAFGFSLGSFVDLYPKLIEQYQELGASTKKSGVTPSEVLEKGWNNNPLMALIGASLVGLSQTYNDLTGYKESENTFNTRERFPYEIKQNPYETNTENMYVTTAKMSVQNLKLVIENKGGGVQFNG